MLTVLAKGWNQCLGESVTEDELWTDDENLWSESLEEGRSALVLDDVLNDGDTGSLSFKVSLLDASLDDIERSSDGNGRYSATDGLYVAT